MPTKYNSLMKNKTLTLIHLSRGKNLVQCKWIYKINFTKKGYIEKHKSWLVAKGFFQEQGIDYTQTFSHVGKVNTIRTIISLVTSFQW